MPLKYFLLFSNILLIKCFILSNPINLWQNFIKFNIPRPYLGYWSKIRYSKPARKLKLPTHCEGKDEIFINNHANHLETGQAIVIPAHASYHVTPNGRFKMISTVIKSGYE